MFHPAALASLRKKTAPCSFFFVTFCFVCFVPPLPTSRSGPLPRMPLHEADTDWSRIDKVRYVGWGTFFTVAVDVECKGGGADGTREVAKDIGVV